MDIDLLRTFLEVNRTRHFGRAAESLYITQAAVSARIKQLEDILGVQLFNRIRRDITLTAEGNRLVRHADTMLAQWRKTQQDVSTAKGSQQLSVGGSLRLWDVLLQPWLHLLRRQHPDWVLLAESHTPELLTRLLMDGVLDLAFMLEPAHVELLQIQPVAILELILVSTTLGLTPIEAINRTDYLMVDWGDAHTLEHRRLFPDALEPRTWLAQAKMALAYLLDLGGSAYLPRIMVTDALAQNKCVYVENAPVITRQAYAVYPIRGAKSDLIPHALNLFRQL